MVLQDDLKQHAPPTLSRLKP